MLTASKVATIIAGRRDQFINPDGYDAHRHDASLDEMAWDFAWYFGAASDDFNVCQFFRETGMKDDTAEFLARAFHNQK